ncbi:MAG: HNH endonuclease [Dehalococcoidia bacterium]
MSVSKVLRFEVLRRDRLTCRYCGRTSAEAKLHVDHLHPTALGGKDTLDNLVTACEDCNIGKAGRLDVAIRGLIQKPLPKPDDDPDRPVLAHFDMPPLDLREQLENFFKHDSLWVSDGVGRKMFLSELGASDGQIRGEPWQEDRVNQQEDWFRDILRQIPVDERWVVERRTGLWTGRFYAQQFAEIGAELGESANHSRELYERGILRLRRLIGLEESQPS